MSRAGDRVKMKMFASNSQKEIQLQVNWTIYILYTKSEINTGIQMYIRLATRYKVETYLLGTV